MSLETNVLPFTLSRPRIELAPEGGWYVVRGEHGWLCGDRQQALREFASIERIERWGCAS
jgi:hypothetical protein